jgi:superfamily II DNA or RNA helicase
MNKLVDDIVWLCRSLGLTILKTTKKHFYKIIISGKLSEIPVKRVEETIQDTYNDLTYAISVVEEPEDEYFGFTLDNNCRYLLNDFTVTHNTCAAISIAEGFKEFVTNKNRKIFVLVKNKNIQLNFMNELQSACAGDEYLTEEDKQQLETATPIERKNIIQTIRKRIQKTYRILTYGTFKNKVESGSIRSFTNSVVIIDEAHNVTNNENYDYLMKILSNSTNYRIVLLTATPIFDNPKEIAEISNLLNANDPKNLFPIRNKLYLQKYMIANPSDYINYKILRAGITEITESGKELLQKSMFGKVSFVASNKDTNPVKIEQGEPIIKDRVGSTHVVLCEMSDYQYQVYKQAVEEDTSKFTPEMLEENESGQQIAIVAKDRYKGVNLYKNSNDASTMVYPNNLYGKAGFEQLAKHQTVLTTELQTYSAKLYNLLQTIKSSPGNIFIYSNYTTAGGTSLVEKLLLKNGFAKYSSSGESPLPKYVIFDRENAETRDKLRKIFNDPLNKNGEQIKIVVGSPVMSEGITLKNVRQVHILEPSWNMSRINQIIGRAVRNYSHHDLFFSDRTVEIYKYVSVYSKSKSDDFFIDKEKYILSEEKDRANKTVERLLKKISFDCSLMKSRNIEKGTDGSPECDYVNCDFDCLVQTPGTNKLDKSTYDLYIAFFEKYLIDFVTSKIQELFHEYYAWNITDIRSIIQSQEPQVNDEIIFHVLSRFVDEQVRVTDKFNRSGFLVNNGDLYIFNPNDIDIKSSLFSKVLDFSVKENKFKLTEYLDKIGMSLSVSKREKEVTKEQVIEGIKPSESDEEYNIQLKSEYYKKYIDTDDITTPQPILGSYIDRNTGTIDGKIRFISPRQQKPSQEEIELGLTDARFLKTGMAGKSFKKDILQQIAKYDLQIPDVEKLYIKTDSLIKIIERTLKEKNLVMKPIPE